MLFIPELLQNEQVQVLEIASFYLECRERNPEKATAEVGHDVLFMSAKSCIISDVWKLLNDVIGHLFLFP